MNPLLKVRIKNNTEKKLFFRNLCIFLFVSINFLPICRAQEFQSFQGKINTDNINIRSDSTTNAPVVCKINRGDRVEVVLGLYEWYKIKLPKIAPSFIKKNLVALIDDKTAKVLKDNVNIRLKPDDSSPILGRVDKNEIISVLGDKGLWYKIEPVNNTYGWIHKQFVEKVPVREVLPEEKTNTINKIAGESKIILPEPGIAQESIIIEGIIRPYGRVIKRVATHQLTTQDEKVFLLKGNKENLDSLNYHKVKVMGKLNSPVKQKYPIIEISKIEVLD